MEWPGFQRSRAELIEDPQEAWAALLVLRRECPINVFGKSRTRAPAAGATPRTRLQGSQTPPRCRRGTAASSPLSSGVTRSAGHPAYQITNGLHTSLPASQLSHQEINNIRAAANGCQARFTCQGIRINC